ncbi:uncharacterized protein LOC110856065 isoform X2 [Folsomia candida]|uniref:uncharacterized protein LOC110856065 isoform X2 n=1 Tax=Folsomia candida TaxID=158441 RepID=UPI0016052E0B|nr:uncharacterized protein LOC110856065 isoform X2 [Folsomia candida]
MCTSSSHLIFRLLLLQKILLLLPPFSICTEIPPLEDLTSQSPQEIPLQQKLEQVFGPNFLKTYKKSESSSETNSSPEDFETVEDEILEERTTRKSYIGLPPTPHVTNPPHVTKFPIIIPSEMDIVTELGDNVVSSSSESLPPYSSSETNSSSSPRKTRGRIATSAHFRRTCGDSMENCDSGRPDFISFAQKPHYCRCDKGTCDTFGDCCWTIAVTLLYRNPWKCHRVQHENSWALMISKCSEEYKSSVGVVERGVVKSCESPMTMTPGEAYTHLHDIPVVSNVTNNLYRNIFCAQCNGLGAQDLVKLRLFLRCSKKFNSSAEREEFVGRAKYVRGKRVWVLDEGTNSTANSSSEAVACGIWSPDLDPRLLYQTVLGIRYCRRQVIDKCPKDYAKNNPTVAALCNSYTQLVESRPGYVFKNPHCAECYGLDAKWDLRCLKEGSGMKTSPNTTHQQGKITPGAAGASLDSTGLSLLFDFDLVSGGNYVGYESTCPGDTMWDFLRQKCTATMCGKEYELDHGDGKCKPKEDPDPQGPDETSSSAGDNDTMPTDGSNSTSSLDNQDNENNANSSCYVLIVHDSEYTLLPNNSVLVTPNKTATKSSPPPPLIFHPGEYEVWNESSISICARDLETSFRPRFSPVLNYLSLSALGCSVVFSLLHILLFVILPKLRNLPGKNLFCLTLSLLISQFLFLAFITAKVEAICVAASVLMHYFFLASFFWMNVMSFDIWRTFSAQFMTRHSSSGNSGLFLKYSLYAWGAPLLILSISTSIDFLFAELDSSESSLRLIRPLYGHNNLCWIGQGVALFLFFALPAVILIALNILLFGWTAQAILRQSRDAQRVFNGDKEDKNKRNNGGQETKNSPDPCSRRTSSSSEAEVQRMKLYMKLGVIMGVTWILGFLSGISEWEWLWYPFVLVNGLQGTFIFFGFDAKLKVWNMLVERVTCGKKGGRQGQGHGGGTSAGGGTKGGRRSTIGDGAEATSNWRRETTTSTTSGGVGVIIKNNKRESISRMLPV